MRRQIISGNSGFFPNRHRIDPVKNMARTYKKYVNFFSFFMSDILCRAEMLFLVENNITQVKQPGEKYEKTNRGQNLFHHFLTSSSIHLTSHIFPLLSYLKLEIYELTGVKPRTVNAEENDCCDSGYNQPPAQNKRLLLNF